jgi:hypothetical protein
MNSAKHDPKRVVDAYKSADAISALEGLEPDAAAKARQARVIAGEITHDQAVAEIVAEVRYRQKRRTRAA